MKHQIPVSKSEPAPSPANALVLGLGSSGEAAARLLLGRGVAVTVIDRSDGAVVDARAAALRSQGACVVTGAMELPTNVYDLCVASPGLPVDSGWVAALVKRGVPVISELELAYRHAPCPILAITGTNGKSTLTRLCGDAMAAAGLRVEVGGNYGTPACETVCGDDVLEWLVWEVSSFQLETCHAFAPRVGVILNIQPDHLDRHGSLAHYAELKVSMLANMADGMAVIVPHSERDRVAAGLTNRPSWQTFATGEGADYCYRDQKLHHGDETLALAGSVFANPIVGQTAAAAWAAMTACGVGRDALAEAIGAFQSLPHRMQQISVHKGVTYVDDSKATNLAAMKAGLRMATGPVHLIAGGQLKEDDLESVKELLANCVKTVYLIGDAEGPMQAAWEDVVLCRNCGTMECAVKAAATDAFNGDWVLLSPGCASFDQYPDYKARGNHFAESVNQLER
ncbi:MAG: UDP-N-acetylmuramoyl-L-alanine--D-glutamate ligase [Verrucomicrobia bacterium]|jgi:UDP-N-acetylmuramoylalanine--D-glutamate ligase|nr:UDP-N-acetylmuramoyl-L-alanine--D-glutamate ligase [Verrucomicrobiota bacterium]MBT7065544.1 UDP-N-acetylmuramoyl-L-alanine--D-glutamate ligase [Verrucomicrobiota bacterium]MBT7700738.1 UDP-N-acetylmuramoyl-L-alanine--D-glutamate ligase [Verrucomicrobiota bacterium]